LAGNAFVNALIQFFRARDLQTVFLPKEENICPPILNASSQFSTLEVFFCFLAEKNLVNALILLAGTESNGIVFCEKGAVPWRD
jgi:hypothetical protein